MDEPQVGKPGLQTGNDNLSLTPMSRKTRKNEFGSGELSLRGS